LQAWQADTPLLLLDTQPDSTVLTGLGGIIGEGEVSLADPLRRDVKAGRYNRRPVFQGLRLFSPTAPKGRT
jgi:hypothetical protein